VKNLFIALTILMFGTACGTTPQTRASQTVPIASSVATNTYATQVTETPVPVTTFETGTLEAVPSFTPFIGSCATPAPNELNDVIDHSITLKDNGSTFITHVSSRFWIYLDDRIYPLQELLNSIPEGLIGYISNGSIRGPQCYPIMFEAVREGKGLLRIKDFQLSIIVNNYLPESTLPMH
jgi:hypothetical protein